MIEVKGVTKRFGKNTILHGIDAVFARNEPTKNLECLYASRKGLAQDRCDIRKHRHLTRHGEQCDQQDNKQHGIGQCLLPGGQSKWLDEKATRQGPRHK